MKTVNFKFSVGDRVTAKEQFGERQAIVTGRKFEDDIKNPDGTRAYYLDGNGFRAYGESALTAVAGDNSNASGTEKK